MHIYIVCLFGHSKVADAAPEETTIELVAAKKFNNLLTWTSSIRDSRIVKVMGILWQGIDGNCYCRMIHGLKIKDGKATYVARYVKTNRLQQEEKYGASKFIKVRFLPLPYIWLVQLINVLLLIVVVLSSHHERVMAGYTNLFS